MSIKFRLVTTAFTGLCITACATTESPDITASEATKMQEAFEYTDCKAYAAHVAQSLDDESRTIVKSTEYDDLIQFHHGWGTGIRNASGLWAGNDELNLSCARLRDRDSKMHPDGVSMIIIEEVWKLLRDMDDA